MLMSRPVCWVGVVILRQLQDSARSHFLEALGMGALEKERPSAGSDDLCSIRSVLLQEKNLPFGICSQGGLGFSLPSKQRGTARQGVAHAGWEKAT